MNGGDEPFKRRETRLRRHKWRLQALRTKLEPRGPPAAAPVTAALLLRIPGIGGMKHHAPGVVAPPEGSIAGLA